MAFYPSKKLLFLLLYFFCLNPKLSMAFKEKGEGFFFRKKSIQIIHDFYQEETFPLSTSEKKSREFDLPQNHLRTLYISFQN